MKRIILASASPRRKELLKLTGLKFRVEPSNVEETVDAGLNPQEQAKALARAKAGAAARRRRNALIIAADTFIVCEGRVLGKPGSEAEARWMLKALSGRAHSVITGYCIIDTESNRETCGAVETRVYFRELTSQEIDAYVKSKEPLDKAGAYAIQGLGSVLVEGIEGDYFNVIGLPLSALAQSLKEFGVDVLQVED